MRRSVFILGLLSLCCVLSVSHSYAKGVSRTVNSAFGFSMEVDSDWIVLSKNNITYSADILQKMKDNGFSDAAIKDTVERISSGRSEMFFLPNKDGKLSENDNVNIIKSIGVLPEKDILPALCESTEQQISAAFQKETVMQQCEYRKHGKFTSVYLEFDGLVEGTKNAQYHLHDDDDFYLVFSLTATKANFSKANLALGIVLNSIDSQ